MAIDYTQIELMINLGNGVSDKDYNKLLDLDRAVLESNGVNYKSTVILAMIIRFIKGYAKNPVDYEKLALLTKEDRG